MEKQGIGKGPPRLEENIETIAEKTKRWVASSEGQQMIKQALRHAEKVSAELKKPKSFDSKSLHTPVTV